MKIKSTYFLNIVKRIFLVFLPLVILSAVIIFSLYLMDVERNRTLLAKYAFDHLNIAEESIQNNFKLIISDLYFLAEQSADNWTRYYENGEFRQNTAAEYASFFKNRVLYDKILFLDATGTEIITIPSDTNEKISVEANTFIFKETIQLPERAVYLTQSGLNSTEQTHDLIFQLATPVILKNQQKIGVLILHYKIEHLLQHFKNIFIDDPGETLFLNREGYWFRNVNTQNGWRFVIKNQDDYCFQKSFSNEWQKIMTQTAGQFNTERGLFTFITLCSGAQCPLKRDDKGVWKIVSHITSETLLENSQVFLKKLIIVYIPLIVSLAIGLAVLAFINYRRLLAEHRLREQYISYARFVPQEFLRLLNKRNFMDIKVADHILQETTIFFSDIRSYTKLSESMSSKEAFNFLNTYFGQVDPLIHKNRGFIDKFIGDAVMAIFPESPQDALLSVLELKRQLNIGNEHRKTQGLEPIHVGLGLHCGEVILGTVGSQNRMQTTVIGDAVNLASRIETLTKVFKVDIILSDCVYERLPEPDLFNLREIDTVRVKGRQQPVVLYEAFDVDPPEILKKKRQSLPLFREALCFYKRGEFQEAMDSFIQCQELCPEDSLPPIYIKRCNALLRVPPGPGWTGISTL